MSSFAEDVAFLKDHVETLVLSNDFGAYVAVVPAFQGRVMTSASGPQEPGNGWINHELIASRALQPHIMPFGGEDRLWLGPEGGQFSIFFQPGVPFDFEHWQTPAFIDTEPFEVVEADSSKVVLQREVSFVNYSGTPFHIRLDRTIELLEPSAGVRSVGYRSDNQITNIGDNPWTKEGGLLSLWVLSMLKHSPTTTVIAPIQRGPESSHGPKVNAAYFGQVPEDRLKVSETHVLFRADGAYRSKIGLSPSRATPAIGSFDPARGLLTVAEFTIPAGATEYVNSMWEWQSEPYAGDVSNSYNDGPPAEGVKALGPFYELESSSPALTLVPGESARHVHATTHYTGALHDLGRLAATKLNFDLGLLTEEDPWA